MNGNGDGLRGRGMNSGWIGDGFKMDREWR